MAQIIKEITVDVAKKNLFQAIVAKQHDSNSRFLKVSFTNEGEPITISSGSSVIINAERADNESKSFAGSVNDDGTVTVPLTNWMLALDDLLHCDISIVAGDESKLTSTSFTVEVEAAANAEGDIMEDENYDILIKLFSDCAEVKDSCNAAANSANVAASLANEKASLAQTAANRANKVADEMETVTENAVKAKTDAETATSKANTATSNANSAADAANDAANRIGDMLQAQNVSYDNLESGLDAGDVKAAVDELAKKIGGVANIVIESWEDVQKVVRKGLASDIFTIGDQLTCKRGSDTLVWDVIGIDHDIPTDKNLKHSLTLQLHNSIGSSEQFDAVEALFYVTNELPAGTYNFTLISGYDESHGGGKTYSFTLTKSVPTGGIIMFPWGEGTYANQTNIKTYGGYHNKTLIETVSVTEGEDGVSLESLGRCNDTRRIRYGSNNWKQSAIRQYLNSNKPGEWWDSMTKFDTEPSSAISAGFLYDMDADFLAVIGEVDKTTVLNTITDGGGSETNAEKFFLLSVAEVYGGTESGISEGNAYPYYSKLSDLSAAGTGVDTNRIKYHRSSLHTTRWLLRTPNASHPSNVRFVEGDGVISNNRASNSYGVAPACCII